MAIFSSSFGRSGVGAVLACVAGAWLAGGGCGRPESGPPGPVYSKVAPARRVQTYHFAIHPLHNPSKLLQSYQPLMDHLGARIPGARFEVEASRDYAEFERKIAARAPEFLLPNPWQTLEGMKVGYHVIAMAGDPEDFKGLFIVRRDSGIRRVEDLRGRAIAYPSATALAACVMPEWLLHQHGIDVSRDVHARYVGSQESAIMNTFLRRTAAGVTWPPPWRAFQAEHPAEAAQLEVAWETEALVNNSVMVRDDLPPELGAQVRRELLALAETAAGRAALAGVDARRFLAAGDADYACVREFVARFEREVRPVKGGEP